MMRGRSEKERPFYVGGIRMEIIMKRLDELKPYGKNPRKNDAAVPKVMESIQKFGFKVPLVISSDGEIITGHTRYKASKNLGLESVPCVVADDLSDDEIKAFRLADNKVSEFSVWDYDLLGGELSELADSFDMGDLGFSMDMSELEHQWDEEDEPESPKEPKERSYSIVYELAFNNEEEQEEWYGILGTLKRKFPDVDTIAERVLIAMRDWISNNE